MESVRLIGTEDVSRAGYNMQGAATDMQRAAGEMSSAVYELERVMRENQEFLRDWLFDFTEALRK